MKNKNTFRILFLTIFILVSFKASAQYCPPSNIGTYNTNYISNVSFGDVSNSSSGATGSYTFYDSVLFTGAVAGEALNGMVSVTVNGWNTNINTVVVWINFNENSDDDLEDNGERFLFTFQDTNNSGGNKIVNVPVSIPIPSTAQAGNARMRVGYKTGTNTDFTPCNYGYDAGEIEDYSIAIASENSSNPSENEPVFCTPINIGSYNTYYISNVSIGNLNNSSSELTGGYTYYNSTSFTDITLGETINGVVSVTLNGWNTETNTVAIWINKNENSDDDFEDNEERFLFTFRDTNNIGGNKVVEVPITIPVSGSVDAALSVIRVGFIDGSDTNFTSCNFNYRAGEVEDYRVNMVQASGPTASNDEMTVLKNSTGGAPNQIDVSSNDSIGTDGGDGDDYALNTLPTNGSITEVSDGIFEYVPNSEFLGTDSFTYNICDVDGDCNMATVNVEVDLGACVPTSNSNGTHYISNVKVVGETVTLDNASGNDGGYGFYLDVSPIVDFHKENTYSVELSVSQTMASENRSGWAVYVDLDQNGVFSGAERLWDTYNVVPLDNGEDSSLSSSDNTFNPGTITIPASALDGTTVMRIGTRRYWYSSNACGQTSQPEEFEDYTVSIGENSGDLQNIVVLGDNNEITSGTTTTSIDNFTNFGIYDINSGALTRSFVIENSGSSNLGLTSPYVSLSGSTAFTIVSQPSNTVLPPGASTTFSVSFDPSFTGSFSSNISVLSDDPDENPFTFKIEGEGAQTFPDTDGDGVPDNIDEDDDNDGIKDIEESLSCASYPYASTTDLVFLNETFGAGLNRIQINGNYSDATTSYCFEDGTGTCPATYNPESVNDGDYTVHYTITNDNDITEDINVDISAWAEDYWYAGEDHTPGDTNGRMAIFNATEETGVFYSQSVTGATPNVPIEFGFYAINIDRDDIDTTELASREKPEVIIKIYDPNGVEIASATSGLISATSPAGDWVEVSASFSSSYSQFTVELSNANLGGLGNDLAIDDIYVKQTLCDLDNDGVADSIDLDNDNDGIPNVVELGLIDDNYDATVNNDSTNPWTDANGNGVHDSYENVIPRDSDNDGTPDYLDLDSDNDGIFDNVEYDGFGDIDVNGNGLGNGSDYQDTSTNDKTDDPDGDGILSLMDDNDSDSDTELTTDHGTFSYPNPIDTDGDAIPDYLDIDSNDAANDISNGSDIDTTIYAGLDTNNDGIIDGNEDSDNDGLLDGFDTNNNYFGSPRDLNDSYSLYFDGRNDYVEDLSNVVQGLSQVTQMAWVKLDPTFNSEGAVAGQSNFWISVLSNKRIKVYMNGGTSLTTTATLNSNEWAHITAVYNGSASENRLKIYINGKEVASGNTNSGSIHSTPENLKYRIGRKPYNTGSQNYFKGEIDEVRVFNTNLSTEELQKIVYQELNEAVSFNQGKIIPKAVSLNAIGGNLIRYFKMDTYKDDVIDDKVTVLTDEVTGAKLYNIKNIYYQTAPLPYITKQDGNWADESTWLHGDVWDIDNLDNTKAWSIIKINNNITIDKSLINLGLHIGSGKKLTVNNDNAVFNKWYLELNGTLDLKDDSQLIQDENSDLVTSSTGKILRRQEGTSSKYWYNYWASPIGGLGATSFTDNNTTSNNSNNSSYSLNMLKKDEANNFEFTNGYGETGKISTYWLYTYKNGVTYYDYESLSPSTPIQPGVGYTQKGTGVPEAHQQYLFEGKPNNGTIIVNVTDTGGDGSVPAVSKTDYLLGNPYASAIDLHKFIDDNENIIEGTIHLWQQWSGASHNLSEYNGGYAQVNKTGSVRAYQFVGIEGETNGNQDGTKIPTRYLPVGQGFVTEIVASGNIVFQNSQRVFVKETEANGTYDNGSVFFRSANNSQKTSSRDSSTSEESLMKRMRLEFNSVNGPSTRRELLLGFSESTSDDFDYGYEAKNGEGYSDDLNLAFENELMTIQAYSDITEDKVVPLVLKTSGNYNYTLKLTETENITEDQEIYIKDNLTGEYFDLRNDQPFEFSSEEGEFNNRLEVVFQDQSQTLSQIEETITSLKFYYAFNRNTIVILNPKNEKIKNIELYNVVGQSVYTTSAYEGSYNEYEVKNLSAGTYIIKLSTGNNSSLTKKIIVN